MDHTVFILSTISGHLGCFHLVAIVKNAAVNWGVEISLQDCALNSFVAQISYG